MGRQVFVAAALLLLGLGAFAQQASDRLSRMRQVLREEIRFSAIDKARLRQPQACPPWLEADTGAETIRCRRLDVVYRGVYLSGLLLQRDALTEVLTIYGVGHEAKGRLADTPRQLEDAAIGPDAAWLLRQMLARKSDVLVVFMPGTGFSALDEKPQERKLHPMLDVHAVFSLLDEPKDSAGAYFIAHVKAFLDRFASGYQRIAMVGRSGGGWTTTLAAAWDPRIRCSVSFFGSLPLKVRLPVPGDDRNDLGDFEQHGLLLFKRLDYTDLYALAAHPNRTHGLVLNEQDDCCFSGAVKGPLAQQATQQAYPAARGVKWTILPLRSEADHYNLDQLALNAMSRTCPGYWPAIDE